MSIIALQLIAENRKTKATFLDLGNCGLTEVPEEIGELVWLKSLTFSSKWVEWDGETWQTRESQNIGDSNRGLRDIGPLAGLNALQTLDVSGTQVIDLAPLSALTSLQSLNV